MTIQKQKATSSRSVIPHSSLIRTFPRHTPARCARRGQWSPHVPSRSRNKDTQNEFAIFLGMPAISTRVIGLAPRKIDKRTFETVLCRGNLIERPFGFERLRIGQASINIDRMKNSCVPN